MERGMEAWRGRDGTGRDGGRKQEMAQGRETETETETETDDQSSGDTMGRTTTRSGG